MDRTTFRSGFLVVVAVATLGALALPSGTPRADALGIAPALPDLRVTEAGIVALPGNQTGLWIRVRNGGRAPAPAAAHAMAYQETKGAASGQATFAGSALAAGAERVYGFTVSAALPAGTYALSACADTAAQVDESNESNNCLPVFVEFTP